MYYLQSRYYDSELRRFISADSIVIKSLAGTNLYMYCANTPVNESDPSGYFSWRDVIAWYAENIGGPLSRWTHDMISTYWSGTFSTGTVISGTPGIFNFSGALGYTIDSYGNVSLDIIPTGTVTTAGTSFFGGLYVGVTNAPSIEALQGNINNPYIGGSCQVGPYPVVVGGDFSIIENTSTDDTFWGGTVYGGYGAGMEGHIGLHTESIILPRSIFLRLKKISGTH